MFHGVTEGWFVRGSLGHPVDGLESDGRVFGPVRDESPASQSKSALRFLRVLADDRNRLRRSDVPTGRPRHIFIFIETKAVSKIALLRGEPIASAHGYACLLRLAAFHFAHRARWAAAILLRAAADMVLRFLPSV